MTILEERGVFWWHDEPIPENCFAPPTCVPGLLRIADDGNITVDLDGFLTSDKGAFSAIMETDDCKGKLIEGLLRVTDRRVILFDLLPHGGMFSTSGLSYTGYISRYCLVSDQKILDVGDDFVFDTLEIDLTGLEQWLRLGSSEVSRSRSTITITHKTPESLSYDMDGGNITIEFSFNGKGLSFGKIDHVEIKDTAVLVLSLNVPLEIPDMQNRFLWVDDLFTILTDSNYSLAWPRLWRRGIPEHRYSWYFLRSITKDSPPEYYKMPTSFMQLHDVFGSLFATWFKKREEFGSGFYLYLGTRRGMQIYSEHLFASLIWGIEALHRKKFSEDAEVAKLKEKVARVLESVGRRDKRWLCGQLKRAHEPSLEKRIFDVLASLPIEGIDSTAIRAFAKKCAGLRNDISHYGSHRHGGSYDAFLRELQTSSAALSKLYHVLMLHEIGVEAKIINDWLLRGFSSPYTRELFVKVGLLSESALKTGVSEPELQEKKNLRASIPEE